MFLAGKGICKACGSGTWNSNTGSLSIAACEKCGQGKYSTATGAASEENCNSCSPGKASGSLGAETSAACVECVTGTASKAASISCLQCSEGRYNDQVGQASCVDCVPGKFSNTLGSKICVNCATNTFTHNMSRHSCDVCPHGRTSSGMTGAASCSTCSTGRVRSGDLNNNYYICNSCQAGQVALAGDNECSDCLARFYQEAAGKGICKACGSGTWNSNTGSISIAA